jgi:hypothetical protein
LRHRFLNGFLLVPVVFAGSMWIMGRVPDNSPEAQDLGNLSINYEFSENYHYKKIETKYVNTVEKYLDSNRRRFKIKDVSSEYGNGYAWTAVYFDKERLTLEELKKIREDIQKGLPVVPGAEIRLGRQEGAESQTWLQVNLTGDDPNVLLELAREARKRLKVLPGFTEVHTESDRGRQEVQLKVNRELARKYNVSPSSVGGVLGIVLRGQQVRGFRTPEGEMDLYVRLLPGDREDLNDLRGMIVGGGPDGREIQLSQVADFNMVKTPANIRRENRSTFTWIAVNYSGDKRDEGKQKMEEVMKSLDYPPGYGWSYGLRNYVVVALRDGGCRLDAVSQRHSVQPHVQDRTDGAGGRSGEQRNRAAGPRQQSAACGYPAHGGDPDRLPRPVPPDHDDGDDDGRGPGALGYRRQRALRSTLLPLGAHHHGRADFVNRVDADRAADLLHHVRRPGRVAEVGLARERSEQTPDTGTLAVRG